MLPKNRLLLLHKTLPGICVGLGIFLVAQTTAWAGDFSSNGHLKGRYVGTYFPDDSLFRDFAPATLNDFGADFRFNLKWKDGPWDARVDYNLIGLNSDSQKYLGAISGVLPGFNSGVISDDRRWWNLTDTISDDPSSLFVQRLDRLSLGYTGDSTTVRFGRQAVSWGNGLIYTPMDIFNPFDPLAVDTEYKTGDDMLYGQWLFDSGNDLQGVVVVRRDLLTGEVSSNVSSAAIKYHGFAGSGEYDLLLSQHYDDAVFGLGGLTDVGDAILRGDLTVTETDTETVVSAVANLSYSWVAWGKNMSGVVEYYHNGFGQSANDYSPAALLANPDLLNRLARGELFTQGKNYLAGSVLIEVSPLVNVSPNLFLNVGDPSGLMQVVAQYDWQQNLQLVGSINFPFGGSGSEFGGADSGIPGRDLSVGPSAFLQLAWYF